MPAQRVIGAVLTGGSSTRMGSPKSDFLVSGNTMASLTTGAIAAVLPTVVAVGRHSIPGMRHVEDGPGAGPVAAFTGLAWIQSSLGDSGGVFVSAVDHPWLRPETVTALAQRFVDRPVVPLHEGSRQVLCAVYPWSFITACAADTPSIQHLLDSTQFDAVHPHEWAEWGEDARSWFSADRVEDVEAGIDLYGPPELTQT